MNRTEQNFAPERLRTWGAVFLAAVVDNTPLAQSGCPSPSPPTVEEVNK
jgi:hypothetical protein